MLRCRADATAKVPARVASVIVGRQLSTFEPTPEYLEADLCGSVAGAQAARLSLALSCPWRSRPQHQKQT
jgi:hypothetical protein